MTIGDVFCEEVIDNDGAKKMLCSVNFLDKDKPVQKCVLTHSGVSKNYLQWWGNAVCGRRAKTHMDRHEIVSSTKL